jgi:hypothetical protein
MVLSLVYCFIWYFKSLHFTLWQLGWCLKYKLIFELKYNKSAKNASYFLLLKN